jgi:ubiquitin C-terminal hydrolase
MNAVLQALRLTPGFLSAILEDFEEYDLREFNSSFILAMHDLYKEILASPSGTLIRPRSFLEALLTSVKRTEGFDYRFPEQMDVNQFTQYLLNQFHECISRKVTMEIIPIASYEDDPIHIQQIQALNAWKIYYESQYSSIVKDFHSQIQSTIECSHCTYKSHSYDSWPIVQCAISDKGSTLIDCFKHTFDSEPLEYKCPTCDITRIFKRRIRFTKFPKHLIVMLKRYNTTHIKNERLIGLDLDRLDLRSFLPFPSPFEDSPPIYQTYAVIHHHGHSPQGGHYTMMGLQGRNWYQYNDGNVSLGRASDVMSKDAYMLFLTHKSAYSRFETVEYPRYQMEA